MIEQNKISFYDPKEHVVGIQRVTLRLVREENDNYQDLIPGDAFVFDIDDDRNSEKEVEGTILGHWVMPFSTIPAEFLLGEGYDIQINPEQDTQRIIGWLLKQAAKRDLSKYYEVDDDTSFHVIAYTPEENFDKELLQKGEGEEAEEWLARAGNEVFSHIPTYNNFKRCDLL